MTKDDYFRLQYVVCPTWTGMILLQGDSESNG
jgi:hypothetical protein